MSHPHQPTLPAYLATAFGDLYGEDSLVVMGKGLGWLLLLASFIRFYVDVDDVDETDSLEDEDNESLNNHKKKKKSSPHNKKPPLVLVLNLSESEHSSILQILQSWNCSKREWMPSIITNESGQASVRQQMYARGGVFLITSRILIVDLLTSTLNGKDVSKVIVGNAHSVTAESTEAFILRIYKSQNSKASVKAITESPETLLQGFARIEKTLKNLQVQKLFLFPRFHADIQAELEETNPPIVNEFHQPISSKMKQMQSALVTAVQLCFKELQHKTPMVEWNLESFQLKNCVSSAFDKAVSRQLEQDWHRLLPSTKQLVHDLRVLRTLLTSLLQYDCVTFFSLLKSIQTMSATSRYPSMWLTTPAADLLFGKAKERLYHIRKKKKGSGNTISANTLVPVLEENPKWRLLKNVLNEIRDKEETTTTQKSSMTTTKPSSTTILVLTRDERSCNTLRQYLVEGRDRTMTLKWLRFLEHQNERSRQHGNASTTMSEESRLLFEEESRVRRILFGDKKRKRKHQRTTNQQQQNAKKQRQRQRKAMTKTNPKNDARSEDQARRAGLEQALNEATEMVADDDNENGNADNTDDDDEEDNDDGMDTDDEIFETMFQATLMEGSSRSNNDNSKGSSLPKIVVAPVSSMESAAASGGAATLNLLLQDVDPDHVILYDVDIRTVRSVEVYAAMRLLPEQQQQQPRLKVYFLMYEASAEQKAFYQSLEKEKGAFERLIHYKQRNNNSGGALVQHTASATTQEMQQAVGAGGSYHGGTLPLSVDTRTAGKGRAVKRDIAVDVREFRSALPSILHQGGMRLAPVTLLVGDFVLSNVHCVERKSISDLFGSFASGRLFTQAEQMSKYYTCPCLLIEFDPEKSFCLQNFNDLGVDIKLESICSRLTLLVLHFPKLRLLWSKSPHETLKLFQELKVNHEEVDVCKAMEVGRADSVEYLLEQDDSNNNDAILDEEDINEAGRDMLLSLPGVTVSIARNIMKECDSLTDLIGMSRDDLRSLAGPVAGQKLFTFFHQQMGSL
ncbi:MAG: hypothetical protein SGILL_005883 [Bacillariaceae sp.]